MSLATAAAAALHADPKRCESVRHPGSRVNVAVHNFKQAWNAANPQKKVPVGTSQYEQSVADALNVITSGMAPAGCSGGENKMEHRRPAPPMQYHRPAPPRAYQPAPPYGYRPEVPRGRFPRQLRPFGYVPQPGMPVDDAWSDDDAIDMPMPPPAPPAVATPPDPPPMAPAPAPGPGPAAPPDSPSVDPSAPPADPSAPPDDSGKQHGKKGGEKPPPGNEEGLSTGAKVGIGVGIAAVLGGIVAVVASKKKKPVGAKERRR